MDETTVTSIVEAVNSVSSTAAVSGSESVVTVPDSSFAADASFSADDLAGPLVALIFGLGCVFGALVGKGLNWFKW